MHENKKKKQLKLNNFIYFYVEDNYYNSNWNKILFSSIVTRIKIKRNHFGGFKNFVAQVIQIQAEPIID